MATKAQSEVKEVKTEMKAKPKKAVIKADTIVRVYNNTTGVVSFFNTVGNWVRLLPKGFQDVTFSDLEKLNNTCPQMLASGSVYIQSEEVRQKLALDYENLFEIKDIDKVLNLPLHEMTERLAKAPRTLQVEVAHYLMDQGKDYRMEVIRTVERITNIPIVDQI